MTGRYVLPQALKDNSELLYEAGVNGDGSVHPNVLDLFLWDCVLREGKLITPEEKELHAP